MCTRTVISWARPASGNAVKLQGGTYCDNLIPLSFLAPDLRDEGHSIEVRSQCPECLEAGVNFRVCRGDENLRLHWILRTWPNVTL